MTTHTTSSAVSRLGFYLHTSWEFNYPFAVRAWERADFRKFFALLQALDFDTVMFWPLTEAMPAPLLVEDKRELEAMRAYVDDAHAHGLEFWATFCPNVMVRPEIAALPFKKRHFYPFKIETRLDDAAHRERYFAHRAEIFEIFNNADAYVSIDGDPGGYPGAKPETFVEVFRRDRAVLNRVGTHPQTQKVVPWLWAGWGADWDKNGVWQEPLEPLTAPVLQALRAAWLQLEPCELLPGRSVRDGWANGRENFALVEDAGLIEKSMLLTYEIIEFEPTPPAVVSQFDEIRRVLKQEAPLIAQARGIMGNAQQPIMAIPNLFFFARAARDAAYLERSELEVLHDLATFLGGDEAILVPAWQCLGLPLDRMPADLPAQLRALSLRSEVAQLLPGGAARYLEILAAFVEARLGVLRACALADETKARDQAMAALRAWWEVHRYVSTGEGTREFVLEYTHPLLWEPLRTRGLR